MPKGVYIRTKEHKRAVSKVMIGNKNASGNQGQPHPHAGNVFSDTIIEHHNDLVHGAERPDDVTHMTMSKHMSLHNKLRVENGTHHLLAKNRIVEKQ